MTIMTRKMSDQVLTLRYTAALHDINLCDYVRATESMIHRCSEQFNDRKHLQWYIDTLTVLVDNYVQHNLEESDENHF